MPDKKYLIEIPDMPESSGVWDADKWERNKDRFMQKYPDANIFEVGQYDPNDMDDNDQFMLSFEDNPESSGVWNADKWERNKDKFLAKYPDAQVNRVRYVDYWGDAAKQNRARREQLSQPDTERDARLAEMGYFDDISGEQKNFDVNDPAALGLKPISSAMKQNSVSGETEYLDPKVAEFYANDTAFTDKLAERARLDAEYESNPQVIAQREYEAELARYADDLKKEIESDMESDVDKGKFAKGFAKKNMPGTATAYATSGNLSKDILEQQLENEKFERYSSAIKLLDKAKIAREVAGKGFGGAVIDWAKEGFMDKTTQSDVEAYNEIGNILTRLEKEVGSLKAENITEEVFDKYLSKDEQALIKSFFEYNAAMADAKQDMSTAYKGGKIFAESIPFMLEFLATGGLYKGAAKAATKGLQRALVNWISKATKQSTTSVARKVMNSKAVDLMGALAGTAVRTLASPGTYDRMAEASVEIDKEGHLNRAKNAAVAAVDMYVENLSEISGGLIGKGAKWVIGKTPLSKIGTLLADNKLMQGISKFMPKLEALGFHGLPEEIGEEFIGNAIREVTGIQPGALKEMVSDDNFGAMLIGFAPMTLLGAAGGAISVGVVNHEASKLGKQMRAMMADHYSTEDIDAMMSLVESADTAEEIQQAIKPMAIAIASAAEKGVITEEQMASEIEALYQWGGFMAQNKALLFSKKAQDNELATAKRAQITDTYGRFWQEDATETVEIATLKNGNTVFVVSTPAEDGMIATVDARTGEKGFANTSDIAMNEADGKQTPASTKMTMSAFLNGEIASERKTAEETRMANERNAQIQAIRAEVAANPRINLGTEGSPVYVVARGANNNGVTVVDEVGMETTIGWDQVADALGKPIIVQTDQQKLDSEVSARLQRLAERRMQRKASASVQEATNEAAAEATEAAVEEQKHIPMNEDGTVNEAAFWTQDPEGYAKWNDEQNQDGGADTLKQIAVSKQELIGMLSEAVAGQNTSNPVMRKAAERQAAFIAEKIQKLEAMELSYAQKAVQDINATPTASMSEEDLVNMDTQYQKILGSTKVQSERVRVMQEYLDKLAEGSIPVVLLTKQNYEEKMKEDGLHSAVINRVKKQVESGRAVAGFMSKGKIYLMDEGLSSTETARVTYIHERQHTFNRTNNRMLAEVAKLLESKEKAIEILKTFVGEKGIGAYDSLTIEGLADEIVAYSMEKAYTTEDFSVDLQSRGIPSDVISIITDIDNEQRKDQSLSQARRRRGVRTHAAVPGTGGLREDERNLEQVSGGVLEQQTARPSGLSGGGAQVGEGAESGEVNASDDENAPLRIAEEAELDPETILNEDGFEIDEQNEDVRFSVRYLPTPDQREGIIDSIIAVTGRTRDEAERWLDSELSLASIVLNDKEYLDYAPDAKYKAIKDNSDYPQGTVDFNNICRKRKDFTRMYTRLQRSYPNRIFTAEDLADIRTIMSEDGLTVACGLCYVEDRRQKLGEVASAFIEDLQDGFRNYAKKGATKKANAVQFTILVNGDNYVPSIYDLITLEGSDKLYEEHRGIWDAFGAYNRARGQQTQNTFQGYAEYKREILTWSDAKVKKVNSLGGLRIFSYSDFEAHHLLDIIQIIIDCAARGVMIQGYTKVPEFARVVEKTGIKLNRSLIPLGDTGIVDEKLAYDPVEGIDINDPNFLESNDNVGNILIGINDEQIRMAMADPFIHYIIPYHARQAGNIRAKLNVGAWTNYIDTQNERKMSDGKRVEKNINIYTDVLNESITNDREFVEKYLEVCREKEYIPKFDQFLDKDAEGNYVYTPGYYKFLVDFKLFDEAGNILPQKAVVAEFDDAFNAQVLNDYAREERETTGNQMNSTYDKIVETLDLGEPTEGEDVQFRTSEGPIDILEEARKIVEREDSVAFRVISDENYEMAQRIINNLAGDTYFRRLEGEYELGKLASNYAELADIIMAIDANKNYTPVGTALLGFFAENPDMHFPLLFNDSKLGKETSKAFAEELSKVNDPYALFFMKEAWRIHKGSLEQAGLGVKPSSTTKFNKAVDARAEEIKAAEVKGTAFNFKKQESSLDEIDAVFKQLNKDPELALLHDRVMSVARTLGVKVSFAGKRGSTAGESLGDKVSYDYKFFNSPAVSDQKKCNTITHELIHSITVYAIYLRSKAPSVLSDDMLEAVDILHDVYNQIARDPAFKGEYGVSDVYEMVAELSNAQFRDKLKEKNLFQRILDALKRLLGIDTVKEDSAYQVLSDTLNYIIDNYDQAAFDAYALYASKNKSYGRMMKIEEAPSFRITPEMDKAYMDAVEAGDMETAQRMVDEAAAAAGYTIRGDHGRVSKFTIFDRDKANPEGNWGQGFYFSNNEEDVENNYANVEGPDLENKIEREVERRINQAEMNEEFNEDGEVDEFAIREAVESEFITSEPNIVHAAIKMNNPFVVGHGMVEIGEGGLGHYDMQETYLTAEYETDEEGEVDYSVDPTGTLVDLVEALNDELSEYEGVNINAYEILSDNFEGMTAGQFEKEARELLAPYVDSLVNDNLEIMSSEIIRAAIERAGFDGIVDNTVNQKFGSARKYGQAMEGMDRDTRHYIAFQSSQIKQTDAVTYDDAGNVIPLSERFNPENEDIRFRVLDTTNAELKEKPIKLNGMYRFKLKNAFKGVKDNGGSYPYIKVQLEEVSDDYSGEKIVYNGILEGFAVVRIPKGLITEGEKDNEFFIDPKAIENELWDVLRATENYYEFKHGGAPYQRDWLNADEVRFRMTNENQAIFVSNAARAVEGIKQEKATPEQWLKMIEKNGGLKAGEDKWMGLSDWLKASDKKTITKQEVLNFINENMIIIEEQHYSDEEVAASANKELNDKYPGWDEAFSMDWDSYMDEPYASIWDNETAVELYNNNHEDQIELDADGEFENLDDESKVMDFGKEIAEIYYRGNSDVRPIHGTRSGYQTRGLSDNHEIALTVPTIERWKADDAVHFGDAGDGRAIAWIRFGETKYRSAGIADEIAALDKAILEYEGETSDEEYKALVEKKHSLLRASRAQKVLVIDEIQSNRHQEGRKRGYKPDWREMKRLRENLEQADREVERIEAEIVVKYGSLDNVTSAQDYDTLKAAMEARREARLELNNPRYGAIPDAPFEKNWAELAMKRMLRYAAENGFDIIAWTTGDQQANRYDLSRDVIKINAYRPNAEGERIVSIYYRDEYNDYKTLIVDKEGKVVQGDYNGSALADVVGKEMSLQIMNAEDVTEFKGDGLKIGGEGMRGFYDKMLPAFMNKYGKKWGIKVEDINLPNLGKSGYTMHSVPVTEEMKSSVMEGQVMFRMRGENESAEDFLNNQLGRFRGQYSTNAKMAIVDYTNRESIARTLGISNEELSDDLYNRIMAAEKKSDAVYLSKYNTIAIFAREEANTSGKADNIFFHENVHEFLKDNAHWLNLGQWLLDNSNSGPKKAIAERVKSFYPEQDHAEEMLCNYTGLMLSLGRSQAVMNSLPEEMKPIWEEILNKFNYNPEYEDSRRKSDRSGDEDARRDASVQMRNASDERARGARVTWTRNDSDSDLRFRTTEITPVVRDEMAVIAATALVNGNYMKAPNGADTNLTAEQWAMVRTENFKAWFGDWENDPENASKVVDENGEPLVIWRGMPWDIMGQPDKEAIMRGASYFSNYEHVAQKFGEYAYPYFMNARNPYVISAGLSSWSNIPITYAEGLDIEPYDEEYPDETSIGDIVSAAYAKGFDSVWVKDVEDEGGVADQFVNFKSEQIKSATDNTGEYSEGEDDIRFSIRTKPAPEKTGIGYKVFYLKDGKLYPPMVANQGGVDTPVGVWLDAEEGTRAGESKTGRPKVKQGGKGTQGGSGTLAYRPGWHLGEIPYAIQFNRKDENGNRTLFPADFVWAEVEYANDVNYQEEAMSYGMNANGKFQHSLAGLPKLPTDGSYRYRTNPNPETDPWIITGAMKVNRLLTPSEVDQMVIDAGREPQERQEGAVTDAQIEALNKELGLVEKEEEVSLRVTGTPTEDVVAEGVSLSPAQLASLAGDIFAALPEDSRKKITNGLSGNIFGLQDAILQIPTSLAMKESWNEEDKAMADVVAAELTKMAGEMTRPFSASEGLWVLYNALNPASEYDILSQASRALVQRNLANMEDADVRFKTVDDSPESIDEIVQKGKQKVADENAAASDVLYERISSINGNLSKLRSAAAAQREYDKNTVKIVADLANDLLANGAMSDMTRYEIKRLLSVIKDAVGKQNLATSVDRLMDIMIANQLRYGKNLLDKYLKIRGKRVDARGIEVRGRLDVEGQMIMDAFRDGITLDTDRLEDRIAIAQEKLTDESEVVRRNAENDLVGYELAKQFLEGVKGSEAEEKDLRDELKVAKQDYEDGRMDDASYRQFVKATYEAIRENRMQRVMAYQQLLEDTKKVIVEGVKKAGLLRDAEKARIERIHHYANSDLQGMAANAHEQKVNEFWNNPIIKILTSPLATFEQWMRVFGRKNSEGKGYLFNHFVNGWNKANSAEYLGIKEAHETLDRKVKSVFGRAAKRWSDLFAIDKKMPKASIRMWDDGEMRNFEVTQGNLLYIYMVNKMTDGKMKLRKMGITEDDVNTIVAQMDPRFLELADWIQDEFLPSIRDKYNAVHERLFGAPMAAIDNYFPIRVLANARVREVDLGAEQSSSKPSTITGSIIKRTKNSLALDVLGSNAFDVVLEHIEQMEHWAAFAEFNRDLNTLLSYRKFRNRVQNMSTAFGSGKEAWNSFKETAEIVAGVYQPKTSKIDKAITNAVKGLTAGKISFRLWTALKQTLSMPAFLPYAKPGDILESLLTPWESWNWAVDYLPGFQKRWLSREAGNVRLKKTEADFKLWQTKAMEAATRWGMTPNAFVDAVTCSVGARAVYLTQYDRYVKDGYSYEEADEKAKLDATITFNATQQSSESAFVSAVQSDRTLIAHALTVFRNNSFGMGRELADALRHMKDRMKRGNKAESIEFMKKQMMRDGLSEDNAERAAQRIYRNSAFKDAARIATFGFVMQFLWNLGNSALYLLFGDDDDEKNEMIKDAALRGAFGSAEGLGFGNLVPEAMALLLSGDIKSFSPSFSPAGSDIASLWDEMVNDPVAGASDLINILAQATFGANPQVIADAALAIYDACNGDMEMSKEVGIALLRLLQAPQSNIDKLIMDEIDFSVDEGLDMTIEQFAKRYAEYKVKRNAAYTSWIYLNEQEKKREDRYIKRFLKDAEEKKRTLGNEDAKKFYEYYDAEYETSSSTIRDLRKSIKEAAEEGDTYKQESLTQQLKDFTQSEQFERYETLLPKIKEYEAYKQLVKDARTPEEREAYEKKMLEARDAVSGYLKEISELP